MLELSGKILVFVNEKEYTNEKGISLVKNAYCTSFSKKDEDDEYVNAYMDVVFSNNLKEAYKLDKFVDGTILEVELKEAWLSFRYWEDSEGRQRRAFYIMVNGASIEEYVKEEEEEKPKKGTSYKTKTKSTQKTTSKRK